MIFKMVIDFFQIACIIFSTVLLIKSLIMRKKVKEALAQLRTDADERQKWMQDLEQRLNVLSKENVKLRTQNEMLKERLRNLGIKDFDVIN